jgi:hypothetical protein
MAHFAKVLDGIVQSVIVADAEFFNTFVEQIIQVYSVSIRKVL